MQQQTETKEQAITTKSSSTQSEEVQESSSSLSSSFDKNPPSQQYPYNDARYRRWSSLASPEQYEKLDVIGFPETNSPRMVFFDVETTIKTNPNECPHIVQVGGIEVDQATLRITERFSFYVKLETTVNDTGERIHHIPLQYMRDAKPFVYHASYLFDMFNNKVWAGHNIVAFDIPILLSEFDSVGMDKPTCAGILDTMIAFSRLKYDKFTPNLKMDTIGKHFGLGSELHDAYEDSLMTYKVITMTGASMILSNLIEDPEIQGRSSPSFVSSSSSPCTTSSALPLPSQYIQKSYHRWLKQYSAGCSSNQTTNMQHDTATATATAIVSTSGVAEISGMQENSKFTPMKDINGIDIAEIKLEEYKQIRERNKQNIKNPNAYRSETPPSSQENILFAHREVLCCSGWTIETMKAFAIGVLSENQIRMATPMEYPPIYIHCLYSCTDGFKQEYILYPRSLCVQKYTYLMCLDMISELQENEPSRSAKQFKLNRFIWCRPITFGWKMGKGITY